MAKKTKAETMTIRIDTNTLAALDMVAAEEQVKSGKALTKSAMIWSLIERVAPHVIERIEQIERETEKDDQGQAE